MTILGHIQARPTRFLAQKTFVIVTHRPILPCSLIFVAIACIFHEAPLLPFFFYHLSPKADTARTLSILVYLVYATR